MKNPIKTGVVAAAGLVAAHQLAPVSIAAAETQSQTANSEAAVTIVETQWLDVSERGFEALRKVSGSRRASSGQY